MLDERISAVAPDMPPFVRRWFLEPDYARPSIQHQDWDLVIADWQYLPLLLEYCEDPANPEEKRFEAFSALLLLRPTDPAMPGQEPDKSHPMASELRQNIQRIILQDRDFARAFSAWIGGIPSLVVNRLLGDPMPKDLPQWMHDQIAQF